MQNQVTGASSADQRAHIEQMLASYPDIPEQQLNELVHWFRHEATALDMGLISSNEDVRQAYQRFRADQLDRLTLREYALLAAVTVALAAFFIFLAIRFA